MTWLALSGRELKALLVLTIIGCSIVGVGWLYFYLGPCKTKLDLLFLIDTSKSVTNSELESVNEFCEKIVNHENIHLDEKTAVRVGFSRFSLTSEWLNSSFNYMTSKQEISDVLRSVNSTENIRLRINTNTSAAIEFVANKAFLATRNKSRKTVILITDGVSDVRNIFPNGTCRIPKIKDRLGRQVCPRTSLPEKQLRQQSEILKNQGFLIIAVQIGNKTKSQLPVIVQDDSKIYKVDDYEALGGITDELSKRFCRKSWWIIFIPGVFTALMVLIKIWLGYAEARTLDRETIENVHVLESKKNNDLRNKREETENLIKSSKKTKAPPPPPPIRK